MAPPKKSAKSAWTVLGLSQLRLDGGTQPRASLSPETIEEYAEAMKQGVQFPPVIAYYDGTHYWLGDGFHRVKAAIRARFSKIRAEVRQGTQRDAMLFSLAANATHGMRRTSEDKRRAVETMLRDPEWRLWPQKRIAIHVGVSPEYISRLKPSLQLGPAQAAVRSGEVEVSRRGKTYRMKTGRIGKHKKPKTAIKSGRAAPVPKPEGAQSLSAPASLEALAAMAEAQAQGSETADNLFVPSGKNWAYWSWEPVAAKLSNKPVRTGTAASPQPVAAYLPHRLMAPELMGNYLAMETAERLCLVCPKVDLLDGDVKPLWLASILDQCRKSPNWKFLIWTRNTRRIRAIEWPENVWLGVKVESSQRLAAASKALRSVKASVRWLWLEPLFDLDGQRLGKMFEWIVAGASDPTNRPPWRWVEVLLTKAKGSACKVFMEAGLTSGPAEYPPLAEQTLH